MFGTIVLGIDESQHAAGAADNARELAKATGDSVVVVHVETVMNYGRGGAMVTEEPEEAHHLVEAQLAALREAGVTATGKVYRATEDHVARVLLEAATEAGAGLIVVGTRGRSDAASMLLGSVAHDIIHKAEIPVLVVRDVNA